MLYFIKKFRKAKTKFCHTNADAIADADAKMPMPRIPNGQRERTVFQKVLLSVVLQVLRLLKYFLYVVFNSFLQ